ncbi:hypothetical protein [Parabacteroides chongii]|uniref:hypothetical protein n=1 Tax=Parabacteroides chongii TaxID=2685834 RepID=UPI00240DDDDD|nr:hypothetical protein [Parabacteroides chongii]WFE84396.1 hypothetical protein P3L47_20010 [Parabacteroides chongii]
MTYLRYIFLSFLLLLSFASCTQDEAGIVVPGEIRLTLNIPGAVLSKSLDSEAGESTITNVYLLFYPQGAADTDAPVFFYAQTGLNAESGSWSKTFKTTEMPQLEPHVTYDVYALASLPDGVIPPTATTTKATLLDMQEKLTDQNASSRVISFSGTSTYTTGTLGEQIIDLKRTVARFDITLDNQTSAQNITLTLIEEPSSVFYLKDKTESPLTNSNQPASNIAGNRYRFYLYEHTTGSRPVRIYVSGTTLGGEPISHYIAVQPDGSSEIKRNYIYNITLTLFENDITVSTDKPTDWSEIQNNAPSFSNIASQPYSNTYIVAPGSKPIRIPVGRPNQANLVNSSIPVIAAWENLEAVLVWTDVKGAVSGLGMAVDASIADIQITGRGPEASLLVTPGTKPGNSVVAVRKVGGDIKWSWQIWVTDYNPDTAAGGTLTTGTKTYTYMDRNLGALTNTGEENVIGTYYQWGRPTPFPVKKNGELQLAPVYDAEGNEVKVNNGGDNIIKNDISELIAIPLSFANDNYFHEDNLWKLSTKTIFDPCPEGWCVPPRDFWNNIKYTPVNESAKVIGYKAETSGIFFPITYCINKDDGKSIKDLSKVYHWTCEQYGSLNLVTYHYVSEEDGSDCTYNNPSWGFPVRCVKE